MRLALGRQDLSSAQGRLAVPTLIRGILRELEPLGAASLRLRLRLRPRPAETTMVSTWLPWAVSMKGGRTRRVALSDHFLCRRRQGRGGVLLLSQVSSMLASAQASFTAFTVSPAFLLQRLLWPWLSGLDHPAELELTHGEGERPCLPRRS